MSTRRVVQWIFLLLLVGMLCSVPNAVGQTESPRLIPRTAEQRKAQYEADRRISLAAFVTDASGVAVTGLTERDFTVLENGISRHIVRFDEISKGGAAQVHGLIVVDGIDSSESAVHRQKKEIKEFLSHAQALPFPVAIVAVTDGGVSKGPASADPGELLRDLDTRTGGLQGEDCGAHRAGPDLGSRIQGGLQPMAQSGFSEADCRLGQFNASMNALHQLFVGEAKAQGRAIVIWLGSGWPVPPEQQRGQIAPGSSTGRAGDLVTVLSADMVEGQVEFDAVSWGEFASPKGVRRVDAAANINEASQTEQEAMLTIPALAKESGGLTFARTKNIPEILGRLLSEDASFYRIVFDPAIATRPDDFRTVQVKVATSGVTVRTMRFYFGQP